jgi:hypothetical protein
MILVCTRAENVREARGARKAQQERETREAREAGIISDMISTYRTLSRVDLYIGEVEKMASVTQETQRNVSNQVSHGRNGFAH